MTVLTITALIMVFAPLLGAIVAGLGCRVLPPKTTDKVTVLGVSIAFVLSLILFKVFIYNGQAPMDVKLYTWASAGFTTFDVGILLDPLSVTMCLIVTFISLMVHIYTIGYMTGDPGYNRFFSYVSLFTFAMLILVLANNFLVLFVGWEGVGLVSYLLIGFWFKREAANFGSLKAFLVNRIGDIGFLIGTAAVFYFVNTLNYQEAFREAGRLAQQTFTLMPGVSVTAVSFICITFFFAAMAKSAQVPMHVWLPESMEGPTPISALIHAATMVTAGIYMVARMSPFFEYSESALSLIVVLGGTTALFMGFVAIVQHDIKRVIAYSTISQLGYMAVALGISAYNAAIFHLITHAFFKALLFLAAGSVIIALHHEQDMRKMGGLSMYLPITYLTFIIGALALSAIPPFSGFYSKDIIIEAAHLSHIPGAHYAYYCVLLGALITPIYIFRAVFLTFNTKERMPRDLQLQIKESPLVVLVPLVLLAIPSVLAGQVLIDPMLFAPVKLLGTSIFVLPEHDVLGEIAKHYEGAKVMALQAGKNFSFWLSIIGILLAWLFICMVPAMSTFLKERFATLYMILQKKYGLDDFNQFVFVRGARNTGEALYQTGDVKLIDNIFVNGSGHLIEWIAKTSRRLQTGYIYHYALVMVIGLFILLAWYVGNL